MQREHSISGLKRYGAIGVAHRCALADATEQPHAQLPDQQACMQRYKERGEYDKQQVQQQRATVAAPATADKGLSWSQRRRRCVGLKGGGAALVSEAAAAWQ